MSKLKKVLQSKAAMVSAKIGASASAVALGVMATAAKAAADAEIATNAGLITTSLKENLFSGLGVIAPVMVVVGVGFWVVRFGYRKIAGKAH